MLFQNFFFFWWTNQSEVLLQMSLEAISGVVSGGSDIFPRTTHAVEVGKCFNCYMCQEDVSDLASRETVLYQIALIRTINLKQGRCGHCT